jgi:hypothetical protein
MQSLSDPLNRFHEDTAWFARAHEVRLLVVRTSGDLRKTVLKLLPMLEFHADNFSPWVVLPDAYTAKDDGWQVRANRLVSDWDRRREVFSKEGIELPQAQVAPVPEPHRAPKGLSPGITVFHNTAASVRRALRDPLRGLVLILSPPVVDTPNDLERDIDALLRARALEACRFVLVLDSDSPVPQGLIDKLADCALLCNCVVDPQQQERDLEAMLGGGEESEATSSFGASPKGVVPPRRVDDPPEVPKEQSDAALREAGINPEFLVQAPRLRNLVLGAALAMKKGQGPDAIRQQREARDLACALEMHELHVICQIALANYLSGLGQTHEAVSELEQSVQYAAEHRLPMPESQAHLALGLLHALAQRMPQAACEYVRAALAAEVAKVDLLAIEGWRLAGQIALQAGSEEVGISSFAEALRVAAGSDAAVVRSSSASEAARQLAQHMSERGMNAQSESLYTLADQMERGEFGRRELKPSEDDAPQAQLIDGVQE